MNELVADIAATALRLAGVSPAVTGAVQRMLPKVIDFARTRIANGGDPAAELDLMMAGAEEAARATAHAKFGI